MSEKTRILVSGSLAYDYIMPFPDKFKNHILPHKIHNLNVSFSVSDVKASYGGTAGNIAYNLSQLKIEPTILTLAGRDFPDYKIWLKKNKININYVKEIKTSLSSSAYIITDKGDNQISGFYGGPHLESYPEVVNKFKNSKLMVIAPDNKKRMVSYAKKARKNKIPYIFDPGQAIPVFTKTELNQALKGSFILILNDYELEMVKKILEVSEVKELFNYTNNIIVTKGAKGSELVTPEKNIKAKAVKLKKIIDPTGAGDAFRAGLVTALEKEYNWKKCLEFAGVVASYAIEKKGTQNHKLNWTNIKERYKINFKCEL